MCVHTLTRYWKRQVVIKLHKCSFSLKTALIHTRHHFLKKSICIHFTRRVHKTSHEQIFKHDVQTESYLMHSTVHSKAVIIETLREDERYSIIENETYCGWYRRCAHLCEFAPPNQAEMTRDCIVTSFHTQLSGFCKSKISIGEKLFKMWQLWIGGDGFVEADWYNVNHK